MALLPESKISVLIVFIVLLCFPAIAQESKNVLWNKNERLSFSDFKKTTDHCIDCKGNFDSCIEILNAVFSEGHYRLKDRMIDLLLKADTERCNEHKETCLIYDDSIYLNDYLFDRIYKLSDSFDMADTFPNWAESALKIDFDISKIDTGKESCTISAAFYPNNSYILFESKVLLEHEQIHFDIYEVFARKFRKYASEHIAKGLPVNFDDAYCRRLFIELKNENNAFDRDVKTGKYKSAYDHLRSANVKWRKKVDSELNSLKNYPPGAIYVNRKKC